MAATITISSTSLGAIVLPKLPLPSSWSVANHAQPCHDHLAGCSLAGHNIGVCPSLSQIRTMAQHGKTDTAWDDDDILLGRDNMSDFNPDNILPLPVEEIANVQAWLQPTAYEDDDSEFYKHLAAHLHGTGKWLLESQEYKDWHKSQENGLLWIRGIPGSGKSVYAAMLTRHLREEDIPVLFFFFRQIIDVNHQPIAAVRDWLAQLLPHSPPLQARLSQYMAAHRMLESLSAVDLWRDLQMALRHIQKIYLVVDALDEMDRGDEMLSFLENLTELARCRPAQTKVVMTSHPVAYLEVTLRRAHSIDIRLQEKLVNLDIEAYVNDRLASSSVRADDQELIKTAVPGHANGLFLYAKLAMNTLLRPGANIQRALETLSQDLNVIYNGLLQDHARRSGLAEETQLLIMQFVTHATRPLRLRELASMMNVTQCLPANRDLEAMKSTVRVACGPLLEILPDETVAVIHHCLTEFLTDVTRAGASGGYPVFEAARTHQRLSLVCLAYLQSEILDNPDLASKSDGRERVVREALQRDTFARYAAKNWYIHARKAALAGADQSCLNPILDEIFGSPKMLDLMIGSGSSGTQFTPVYAASVLGLHDYVKILLLRPGIEVNQGTNPEESPLCYASRNGYADIVKALLKAGADPCEHSKDFSRLAPLHYAVRHNHPEVIKILLDSGADPMMAPSRPHSCSAFAMACTGGHLAALKAFLPYLSSEALLSRAILWVAPTRRSDMMAAVLGHPLARIDKKTKYTPPLFLASAKRDPSMVKLLLQAGADATMVHSLESCGDPNLGYNALHGWAATQSQISSIENHDYFDLDPKAYDSDATIEVFNLLLEAGADINQLNDLHNTPLHYARDVLAARLLIDAGADVSATNRRGETLVHLTKSQPILQYLLDETSVFTKSRNLLDSMMLRRLRDGYIEQAQMFFEYGANPSVVDSDGQTAVHLLAVEKRPRRNGAEDARVPLLRRLLQSGLDINARNSKGQTALHLLDFNFREEDQNAELFQTLLHHGADIEAKDHLGQTPLFCKFGPDARFSRQGMVELFQVNESHEDDIQWLAEHGIDPRATDADGNTLFHELLKHAPRTCYKSPDFAKLEKLVSLGVDPQQANAAGRTPLHIASTMKLCAIADRPWTSLIGSTTVFDWLLNIQHDVDAADRDGITAFHLASTLSEYMAQRLLERGADPLKPTKEGLNGLHLAARARQVNILGMILETVVDRAGDTSHWQSTVGICTGHPQSPMFYACASGRLESVKLLLDAGLGTQSVDYQGSALQGAVSFEDENQNWSNFQDGNENWPPSFLGLQKNGPRDVKSVTLHDEPRTTTQPNTEPSERIDEILEMLVSHELVHRDHVSEAVEEATKKNHAYTLSCLLKIRDRLSMSDECSDAEAVSALIESRKNAQRPFTEKTSDGKSLTAAEFTSAMKARFFDVVCHGMTPESSLQTISNNYRDETLLEYLVKGGYSEILGKIANSACIVMHDNGTWMGTTHNINPDNVESLLITACRRVVPNMEVIKLLVERFGVDVNGPEIKARQRSSSHQDKPGSALYVPASGGHWWQVAEAMPYLITHGADVNKRDERGLTPLNAILKDFRDFKLGVSRRALEVLVKHGADLNSVDERGLSCIERAMFDGGVLASLLRRLSNVPSEHLISAIRTGNLDVVERLLKAGADPNGRKTLGAGTGGDSLTMYSNMRKCVVLGLKDDEKLPLHCAMSGSGYQRKGSIEIIELLLKYGADPLAKYDTSTMLHQLLAEGAGQSFSWLLEKDIPGFDPNCADAKGATLFHLACQYKDTNNQPTLAEILLSRGADIYAKGEEGWNTLHYLAGAKGEHARLAMLRRVAALAPELVNERDKNGLTPLHLAVGGGRHDHDCDYEGIAALVDAGADASMADNKGNTALHILLGVHPFVVGWPTFVVEPEERKVVDRLLACPGVDINAANRAGETPIFAYLRSGQVMMGGDNIDGLMEEQLMRALQHLGIDKSNKLEAVVLGKMDTALLDMFAARGVDWLARNNRGETLMHVGVQHRGGAAVKVRYLLGKGVDPAAEDEDLRTALDVAASLEANDVLGLFGRDGQDAARLREEEDLYESVYGPQTTR
ncbi:ankyrin 2,3/unc44, putative [Cordyceps militaris CM01]|uniref:Ankyrin 2,3/unc44, putative n=1 Tax=Cordyceps militaris (strain CM01) TaxID=983644 RepID=G3J2L4_CORMM|nr:ankyrin 2,3/unc44, putative [Cordyceps militaris CM01]EGX95550.1 ankyrin 2,3/unc44, putative [Cordyceps militaris CM01]